jgi:hypothetical protein
MASIVGAIGAKTSGTPYETAPAMIRFYADDAGIDAPALHRPHADRGLQKIPATTLANNALFT